MEGIIFCYEVRFQIIYWHSSSQLKKYLPVRRQDTTGLLAYFVSSLLPSTLRRVWPDACHSFLQPAWWNGALLSRKREAGSHMFSPMGISLTFWLWLPVASGSCQMCPLCPLSRVCGAFAEGGWMWLLHRTFPSLTSVISFWCRRWPWTCHATACFLL